VRVKAKNGRVQKKYDITENDSNSLENIANIEDQDPYDEQKSGGEEEIEDSRSVHSAKSVKSSRS